MTTKRLVRISYFAMLTIIGGLIRIPIKPVMITLQTLFVAASGLMLGARDGAIAQIAYLLLGLIGLPVFSEGGGIMYVIKPSFGYLLSFPVQAFLTGFSVSKLKTLSSFKLFLCAAVGVAASYIIGMTYQVLILVFVAHLGLKAALLTLPAVSIMIVKDLILVYVLCLLYPKVKTLIGKMNEKIQPVQDASQSAEPPKNGDDEEEKGEENKGNKNPEPVAGEA